MKLTGYTPEQVDDFVTDFYGLMIKQMQKTCKTAAEEVSLSSEAIIADGALTTAIDSLGVLYTQWKKSVTVTLMPFLAHVFMKSGEQLATPLGDVSPVKTTTALGDLENMVTSFSDEMWDTAKTALVIGAHDGESIAELAARVENVTHVKAKKAHVIAQTAVIGAVNGGEWQQMMEMAAAFKTVVFKEWVSTHDSHTRPTHHAADGQRVTLNEPFTVGGGFLQYPGDLGGPPEEIISCRCTTAFDVLEDTPITASQTSPKTLLSASAVSTINAYWPLGEPSPVVFTSSEWQHEPVESPSEKYLIADTGDYAVTAAVNSVFNAQHPRGKDGKFIKKGEGLPEHILQGLIFSKKSIDWALFTPEEKKNFISEVQDITPAQWGNLKNEDKIHISTVVADALNEGEPGSGKASLYLEDLALVETGDTVPDIFNPSTVLPAPAMTPSAASAKGVEKNIYEAYDAGHIDDQQQQFALDLLDNPAEDPVAAQAYIELHGAPAMAAPVAPTLTTGSSTPVKITHGLIHAKHTPGTVIAQSTTGTKITWNGSSYDISNASGGGEKGVKKSKLYALLNTKYKLAEWKTPGKQEIPVTHATHLDAAPPANPIPHPVAPTTTPWTPIPGLSVPTPGDTFGDPGDVKTEITAKYFADEITQDQFNELVNGINDGTLSAGDAKTKLDAYTGTNALGSASSFGAVDDFFKNSKTTMYPLEAVLAQGQGHGKQFRLVTKKHTTGLQYVGVQEKSTGTEWDDNGSIFNQEDFNAWVKTQESTGISWNTSGTSSGPNVAGAPAGVSAPDITDVTTTGSPTPFHILADTGKSGDGYAAPGLWGKYGAAGVMIKNTDANGVERYLMVQRGPHVEGTGLWQLAGGAIDSKETPEQGAAREIFEEIGAPQEYLSTMVHKGTHAVGVPIPGKEDWVYSNIAAEAPTMFTPKVDGSETGDAKWLTKDEINKLVSGGTMHPALAKALPSVFALYDTAGNNESNGPSNVPAHVPATPTNNLSLWDTTGMSHEQAIEVDKLYSQYSNGILTDDDVVAQIALIKAGGSAPTVNTPSVSTPVATTPTPVTAADIPSIKKAQFYQYFKNEKVSPAWSGAKIYASLHAAKQKMSGDSQVAALSDGEMLKLVDKMHWASKPGASDHAYSDKVHDWLKTPNGKKAFAAHHAGGTPIGTTMAAKVAKKTTPTISTVHASKTASELTGTVDANVNTSSIYAGFKASGGPGSSSSHGADDIYAKAKQVADAQSVSIATILNALDVETEKKYGAGDKPYAIKIKNWLETTKGLDAANQIDAGTYVKPVPAKKNFTKKASGYTSSYDNGGGVQTHVASAPLVDKVHKVDQAVPPWNPDDKTKYPTVSTSEAANLWSEMQQSHGNMTNPQKGSLKYYTSNSGYSNMNNFLRGKQGASDATKEHVTNAQNGMRPTTQPIILHRGSGWFTSGSTGQQWTSYANIKALEGGTFHNESFFSASVGGEAAFGGNIKFEIECPVGTPMAYVKAFSKYGGENEMLLAADLNFKIMTVTQQSGHVVVRLRVMAAE